MRPNSHQRGTLPKPSKQTKTSAFHYTNRNHWMRTQHEVGGFELQLLNSLECLIYVNILPLVIAYHHNFYMLNHEHENRQSK